MYPRGSLSRLRALRFWIKAQRGGRGEGDGGGGGHQVHAHCEDLSSRIV